MYRCKSSAVSITETKQDENTHNTLHYLWPVLTSVLFVYQCCQQPVIVCIFLTEKMHSSVLHNKKKWCGCYTESSSTAESSLRSWFSWWQYQTNWNMRCKTNRSCLIIIKRCDFQVEKHIVVQAKGILLKYECTKGAMPWQRVKVKARPCCIRNILHGKRGGNHCWAADMKPKEMQGVSVSYRSKLRMLSHLFAPAIPLTTSSSDVSVPVLSKQQ